MKNPKQNAQRWFKEASNTLQQAKRTFQQKDYNLTCFLAEQTTQKALKAVLYGEGERFINIHSIAELIKTVAFRHPDFSALLDKGAKLDQYYLSTRYPDAIPEPAIPSEIFSEDQAKEALEIMIEVFGQCENLFAGDY